MISAVIPVYNEIGCIAEFSTRLWNSLSKVSCDKFEIIYMVGGTDGTIDYLLNVWEYEDKVKIVYEKERGLGTALIKGFHLITDNPPDAHFVLTMDADLQQLPEQIERLADAYVISGFLFQIDCVIGRHGRLEDGRSFFKRWTSRFANAFFSFFFRLGVDDITSNFRLYTAEAIRAVRDELTSKDFQIQPEILIRMRRAGYSSFFEEDIDFPARATGVSKLSWKQTLKAYLSLIRI